ncbi:MAG: BUG/TctC family periplasmic protein, partial [uncultured Craurococcus sp.]
DAPPAACPAAPAGCLAGLGLPRPPDHAGHGLRARRLHRYRGAAAGGPAGGQSRAGGAGGGGEPARRRGHRRQRLAAAAGAGRAHHHAGRELFACHRPGGAGRRHALQSGDRFLPSRRHRHRAAADDREQGLSRRNRARGAGPAARRPARERHLRHLRRRHDRASGPRDAGARSQDALRPRALSQRRANADGDLPGRGAVRHRRARLRRAAGAGRHGAGHRGDRQPPLPLLPRPADPRRGRRARLRHRYLEHHPRPARHAGPAPGGAEPRPGRLPRRAGAAAAAADGRRRCLDGAQRPGRCTRLPRAGGGEVPHRGGADGGQAGAL